MTGRGVLKKAREKLDTGVLKEMDMGVEGGSIWVLKEDG